MNKLKKIAAGILSAVLAASGCLSAHGAGYDESLYVNLDHYGNIYEQRIIKGFALDGEDELIDYGEYKEVINKTSYTKPDQLFDKVRFDVSDVDSSRFYIEAVPEKLNAEIPWNINVSYRLNGVEKKVEELQGACGLVEINADLIPNENTSEYFKNNMVMTVAAAIDMDKHLSMEAEGAQVQAFGNYKAVLYLVFPGEEKNISIKIGSEDFEFLGLVFIMAPATLDQLDKIADLREAKETLEDSAETMNESLDVILDTLDSMKTGIDQTSQGLRELEEARQTVSDDKDDLFYEAERAMEEFENVIASSVEYDEHIEEAESALSDLNDSVKSVQDSLHSLSNELMLLKRNIRSIQKDVRDLNKDLDYARYDISDAQTRVKRIQRECDDLDKSLENLEKLSTSLEDAIASSINGEEMLANIIKSMDNPQMQMTLGTYMANIKTFVEAIKFNYGGAIDDRLESVRKDSRDIYDNAGYMMKELDNALSHAYNDVDDVQDLLDDADALGNISMRIIDSADNVVSDIDNVLTVLYDNYDGAIDTMEDVRGTLKATQTASAALDNFLRDTEVTVKDSSDDLDNGLKDTFNGLADVLDNTSAGLGQTGIIRNAKNTVKNLIDDKWEEYTGGDNNLLYTDPSQEKISLTSSKNPEPETIQIILRTDEITNEKEDEDKNVDEEFHAEGTFISRLKNIFKNIFGR